MKYALFALFFAGLFAISMTKPKSSVPIKELLVVIDVAHGGEDVGAHAHGATEKQIVQAVATQIELLDTEQDGIQFVFTRTSDESITLAERVEFINKVAPDFVISLHANQAPNPEVSGAELYIHDSHIKAARAKALASSLSHTLESNIASCTATTKEAGFYILKHTNAPAVLFEMGFVSSDNDHMYLTTESGQLGLARSIIEGLSQLER